MYSIKGFIEWALTHVNAETAPPGATLASGEIGTEPWHYLYGTVRVHTTRTKIDERWNNYYKRTWTREAYDNATKNMRSTDYATDCQGLLDAYLTYECGESTDINANANYSGWCTQKGKISRIERPYIVGEAVFIANGAGSMTHVGWICGFDVDGEPLVVEARGLLYGVVITRISTRSWTHRGLMTKKFSYESEDDNMTIFEVTSPMKTGNLYKTMQKALNAAGYRDKNGKKLSEDGKWGQKSQEAFDSLLKTHGQASGGSATTHKILLSLDGKTVYSMEV